MDFGVNKTPIEVIREGAFGGTYFRDIFLVLMGSVQKIVDWIWSVKKYSSKVLLLRLLSCECQ